MAEDQDKPTRILIVDNDGDLWESVQTEYKAKKAEIGKSALPPTFADTVRASQSKLSDRDFNYAGVFVNPGIGTPAWLAVIRTSHQYRSGTPVFVIYDERPKISDKEASQLGVYGFFKKPITYDKILELITGDEEEPLEEAPPAPAAQAAQHPTSTNDDDYLPVELVNIVGRIKSMFDLFVRLSNGKYVKILNSGDILSADRIESYKAKGMTSLFILKAAQADYLKFYDTMVDSIVKDTTVAVEVKQQHIAAQGQNAIQFLKSSGFSDESMASAESYVKNTTELVTQIAAKSDQVKKLLDDVTTYEHAMACSTLAGLMIKHIGGSNPVIFNAIGIACFLHDISLVGQPQVVLDDDLDAMTPEQKTIYLAHPEESAKLVKKMKGVPPIVVTAVAQHHLRANKGGFPEAKAVNEVNRISELVGLAEEFLKLLKKKETDPSIDPFTILKERARKEFSEQMVDAFIRTFQEK